MDKFSFVNPTVSGKEPSPRSSSVSIELLERRTILNSEILVLGGWCRGECNGNTVDSYYMDSYLLNVEMDEHAFQLGQQKIRLLWSELPISGDAPSSRVGYSASLCGNQIFIFGGGRLWSDGTVCNDLFVIDTLGWAWQTKQPLGTAPCPRQGHTSIVLPNEDGILIIGGTDNSGVERFQDYHILHFEENNHRWSTPTQHISDLPCGAYMSSVQVGSSCFVFGGSGWDDSQAHVYGTMHRIDTADIAIKNCRIQHSGRSPYAPCLRFLHASCIMEDQILVHGGWTFLPDIEILPHFNQYSSYTSPTSENVFLGDCKTYNVFDRAWSGCEDIGKMLGVRFGHSLIYLPHMKLLLSLLGSDGVVCRSGVTVLSAYRSIAEDLAQLFSSQVKSSKSDDIRSEMSAMTNIGSAGSSVGVEPPSFVGTDVILLQQHYIHEAQSRGIGKDVMHLLDSGLFSDISLTVSGADSLTPGDCVIKCHKNILAARSEVFRRMLTSPFKESSQEIIEIDGTAYTGLLAFIKCVYGASVRDVITEDTVMAVLELSERFGVLDIKFTCEALLCGQVDEENVLDLFRYADAFQCPYLLRRCMCILFNNRMNFSSRNDILMLRQDFPAIFEAFDTILNGVEEVSGDSIDIEGWRRSKRIRRK